MPFSWDNFPYTNFHELNLDWFLKKFKEIFDEWNSLYDSMLAWKETTDEEIQTLLDRSEQLIEVYEQWVETTRTNSTDIENLKLAVLQISSQVTGLQLNKLNIPTNTGHSGQVPTLQADGTTKWEDKNSIPVEAIPEAVDEWFSAHPDATTRIADYVVPTEYGAIGDGITDDSDAFDLAIQNALQTNKPIYIGDKNYLIKNGIEGEMPAVFGTGGSLNIGNRYFVYSDGFFLSNIKIISEFSEVVNSSYGTMFTPMSDIITQSILLENLIIENSNADNTHRGRNLIRINSNNVFINNIKAYGCANVVRINNDEQIESGLYIIKNVYAENAETVVDIEGYTDSSDYSGYLYNVRIDNITLKNTVAEQSNKPTSVNGLDCVLCGNIKNFSITNIYSYNAIERGIYITNSENGFINNVYNEGSQGIKIAGLQLSIIDPENTDVIYTNNISIKNLTCKNAPNGYAIYMYQVSNIDISNVYIENDSGVYMEYGIGFAELVDHVNINHVRGRNSGRRLIYFYQTANQTLIEYVTITDIDFNDPVTHSTDNYAILFNGSSAFCSNIVFEDIHFNNSKNKYRAASKCLGFINVNYTSNISIINCEARDIKTIGTGWLIGDNCHNVYVDSLIETINMPPLPDFKFSRGEVKIVAALNNSDNQSVSESIPSDSANIDNIVNTFTGEYNATFNLPPSSPKTLLPATAVFGLIEIETVKGYYKGWYGNGVLTTIENSGTEFITTTPNTSPNTTTVYADSNGVRMSRVATGSAKFKYNVNVKYRI